MAPIWHRPSWLRLSIWTSSRIGCRRIRYQTQRGLQTGCQLSNAGSGSCYEPSPVCKTDEPLSDDPSRAPSAFLRIPGQMHVQKLMIQLHDCSSPANSSSPYRGRSADALTPRHTPLPALPISPAASPALRDAPAGRLAKAIALALLRRAGAREQPERCSAHWLAPGRPPRRRSPFPAALRSLVPMCHNNLMERLFRITSWWYKIRDSPSLLCQSRLLLQSGTGTLLLGSLLWLFISYLSLVSPLWPLANTIYVQFLSFVSLSTTGAPHRTRHGCYYWYRRHHRIRHCLNRVRRVRETFLLSPWREPGGTKERRGDKEDSEVQPKQGCQGRRSGTALPDDKRHHRCFGSQIRRQAAPLLAALPPAGDADTGRRHLQRSPDHTLFGLRLTLRGGRPSFGIWYGLLLFEAEARSPSHHT